ncbi:MAG: hypothetical protein J6B88_03695 [Clostridia bacterium]|nr:hypothetical protein [Clostridia bacterium]
MKKILSFVLILTVCFALCFPLSITKAEVTGVEHLNDVNNWSAITGSGGVYGVGAAWLSPAADTEAKGGTTVNTIKFTGVNAYTYATKLTVAKNQNYKISFDYYSENLYNWDASRQVAYNAVGIAPLKDGNLIYRSATTTTPAALSTVCAGGYFKGVYSSGMAYDDPSINTVVTKTDDNWYNLAFEFNSAENEEVEFFILTTALGNGTSTEIANIKLEEIVKEVEITSSEELNNVNNWSAITSSGGVYGVGAAWLSPAADTEAKGGTTVNTIKFTGVNAYTYATKLTVAKNQNYKISFDYYSENLYNWDANRQVAYNTVGVAPLKDGNLIYRSTTTTNPAALSTVCAGGFFKGAYSSGMAYDNPSINTVVTKTDDNWYNLAFEFNSAENEEVEFFILTTALGNGTSTEIANIKLEEVVETEPDNPENPDNPDNPDTPEEFVPDNYFETVDNWAASVNSSQTSPSKNIFVSGISNSQTATPITWASFTNNKDVTAVANGSSLVISNPFHVSHIKLPEVQVGATYKLKFAYKPIDGQQTASVLRFVGVFDPELAANKISSDNAATFSNLKTGFLTVDNYSVGGLDTGRYRFENGVFADNCYFGGLNKNTYDDVNWRYEELYFTITEETDNPYLLISYTTEAGKLIVDDFAFETVSEIPESQMPGYKPPSDAPKLDNNNERVIDMEQNNIVSGDTEFIKQIKTGGYGNNGSTLFLPSFDHTTSVNPTKVTTLNYTSIVTNKNDPYFRTAVKPETNYRVTVRVKVENPIETNSHLILFGDAIGYYKYNVTGNTFNINYSDIEPNVWNEYTIMLKTASEQDEICFYFNAGEKYPDLFIDEVLIKEIPPRYTGPSEKVVIDFEDDKANYNHVLSDRIKLETTQGVDGNSTKALHIPELTTPAQNVAFLGWGTTNVMSDPVFTIPVEENTLYSFSYYIKYDNTKNIYSDALVIYYDYSGTYIKGICNRTNYSKDPLATEWTKVQMDFVTLPGQNTVTFTFNAGYYNPGFWLDNITYEKAKPGFKENTKLSYCEAPFNLIAEQEININGTIAKETVLEISIAPSSIYTFGVDVSGKGNLILAFDKEGKDVIKNYDIASSKNRIGAVIVAAKEHSKIYVIIKPQGTAEYKDLYLFKRFSIALGSEMGREENVNNKRPISFSNVPTVKYNSLEELMGNDNSDYFDSDTESSPNTGDPLTGVGMVIITLLVSLGAMLFCAKKKVNAY